MIVREYKKHKFKSCEQLGAFIHFIDVSALALGVTCCAQGCRKCNSKNPQHSKQESSFYIKYLRAQRCVSRAALGLLKAVHVLCK